MKRFLLYIVFAGTVFAGCAQKNNDKEPEKKTTTLPIPKKPGGWVSDFAEIFTPEQRLYLGNVIAEHEKITTNQIAVVICNLDSALVQTTADFEAFTLELFNQWRIGTEERKNGIALIIIPNLRRIRIEVGYGLESKLTNSEAKTIIDSIILPEFKNADYFTGTSKGLEAIINEIK